MLTYSEPTARTQKCNHFKLIHMLLSPFEQTNQKPGIVSRKTTQNGKRFCRDGEEASF